MLVFTVTNSSFPFQHFEHKCSFEYHAAKFWSLPCILAMHFEQRESYQSLAYSIEVLCLYVNIRGRTNVCKLIDFGQFTI